MRTPRLPTALAVVIAAVVVAGFAPHRDVVAARHPEIQRAITALERAKTAMQHASHDFGGHRVAALGAADEAIKQLRAAMQYDK